MFVEIEDKVPADVNCLSSVFALARCIACSSAHHYSQSALYCLPDMYTLTLAATTIPMRVKAFMVSVLFSLEWTGVIHTVHKQQ